MSNKTKIKLNPFIFGVASPVLSHAAYPFIIPLEKTYKENLVDVSHSPLDKLKNSLKAANEKISWRSVLFVQVSDALGQIIQRLGAVTAKALSPACIKLALKLFSTEVLGEWEGTSAPLNHLLFTLE